MERDYSKVPVGPLKIRVESGEYFKPDEIAESIVNMGLTPEGTLKSIVGPCSYSQIYEVEDGSLEGPTLDHGRFHGIFHCVLFGYKDILLVHVGDTIKVFQGWRPGSTALNWKTLIGQSSESPQIEANITDDTRPRWPTQFVATPTGVVIIPQEGNAFFYDGTVVVPLGYTLHPGQPSGHGPQSSSLEDANDEEYAHDGNSSNYPQGDGKGMHRHYGLCRLGSVRGATVGTEEEGISGILESGEWQLAYCWVDRFGNLSPISPRSNSVTLDKEQSILINTKVESLRKQIMWSSILSGRKGTVGRICFRTRDLMHSGTNKLFEVPGNAGESSLGFATIPDNVTQILPDNVPDIWLIREAPDLVSVPKFKLACLAFGRLFITCLDGDKCKVMWSWPGRWGTFNTFDFLYPDPTAPENTAIKAVEGGVLVTTETSSFLITPSMDGRGFQYKTINPSVGCVSPNTMRTTKDGITLFLTQHGFYGYKEGSIQSISDDILQSLESLNQPRINQSCACIFPRFGEYACWVPTQGSNVNDLCYIFDGQGWKKRNDVKAVDVCVTKDHRRLVLVAGTSEGKFKVFADPDVLETDEEENNGVWVLDHENWNYEAASRASFIKTSWFQANVQQRKSPFHVFLWLREISSGTLSIQVQRDWRTTSQIQENNSLTTELYSKEDVPPFWDTFAYGDGSTWKKRRPYWTRVDVFVPACEVFRLVISKSGVWEFIALSFSEGWRPAAARVGG